MKVPQLSNCKTSFNPENFLSRKAVPIDHQAVSRHIHNANLVITGAAGSIGSELAMQICAYNPKALTLIDQSETLLTEFENLIVTYFPKVHIKAFVADITDQRRMEQILWNARPDILFHAAAYKHVPVMEKHPYEAIKTNVLGTKLLADLAVQFSVSQFIFISTDKAVKPAGVMGATKRIAELYIRHCQLRSNTRFVTTRFGNVLGSNGSFTTIFEQQLKAGGPITITHPDATRYLMTPHEACQLVLQASTGENHGEILFFEMDEPVSIVAVAEHLIRSNGLIPYNDIPIVYTGLRPGEKLNEELLNDDETEISAAHSGMRIAVCNSPRLLDFDRIIKQLNIALDSGSDHEMIATLKDILPEYKKSDEENLLLRDETALLHR